MKMLFQFDCRTFVGLGFDWYFGEHETHLRLFLPFLVLTVTRFHPPDF